MEVREKRFVSLADRKRDSPMRRANMQGPARSPTVLETPRPASAKADAHWLMACSPAPEQIIMTTRSQNRGFFKSPFRVSASPSETSSSKVRMGTAAK